MEVKPILPLTCACIAAFFFALRFSIDPKTCSDFGLFMYDLSGFLGVVFAAFGEEMLFRGVLQRSLEHFREPAIAIVLSSVLFSIIHFNPWAALQIMFLGLFLGYLAWKANSIFPAIVLHGINNLLSIILINIPEENLKWYSATTKHVNLYLLIFAIIIIVPAIFSFNQACEDK